MIRVEYQAGFAVIEDDANGGARAAMNARVRQGPMCIVQRGWVVVQAQVL